jgi:pimeloyl-ACP methyl ester carboxylesterase
MVTLFTSAAATAQQRLDDPFSTPGAATTAQRLDEVTFTDYAPLSGSSELVRRLFSPLAAAHLAHELERSGKTLNEQALNLAEEKFGVYVPSRKPPGGYGLMVFVPPWPDTRLPPGWGPVLDRYGVIFVSAARSGNDQSVLGRRVPLALLAEENAARRYPVDPQRVYIAGFSGGSHVAMRLALGYPDTFRGAILNAGSDPIGSAEIPLPPRDLFLRFQSSTRVLYITGARDSLHRHEDEASMTSMRSWCVPGSDSYVMADAGHEVADPDALSRALYALRQTGQPDPHRLDACRSGLEKQLASQFEQLQSLIAGGRRDAAGALLRQIDQRFGGLAAPRSVALASGLLPP